MKSNLSIVVAASTLALLSACGGSSDTPAPPTGTQAVAITSTNQSDVARSTFNGGFSLGLVQSATTSGTAASPASVAASGRVLQVLRAAIDQRKGIASASEHPATGGSQSVACGISGSMATTWNDADGNNQLSAGDVLTASFQQCQETTSLSINGSLAITLSGTPSATQFSANAVFQNIVAVDAGVTYTIAGAVALTEVDTDTISSSSFTVGSGGLTVAIASTGYSDSIAFDSGMVVASSFLAGTSSLTLNGSIVSHALGGRVTIATQQALVQQATDTYPSQGKVLITGASGSTLLVTVLGPTQVHLQVDANGDGTVDGTTPATWASLLM